MTQPTILIGLPVYNGWDHVAETLASIKSQTFGNFRVLISVDGNDRRSFDLCERHKDHRCELVLQPTLLGWAENINFLASRLGEDFFCYWQHDDYCDPRYLETLLSHAARHPEASSVYCDMRFFGEADQLLQYPSVTGFALERVFKQAATNNPAPIRCLIRADAMRAALPIRLAATWAIALARAGELHRVPQTLYFRRLRPDSLGMQLLARSQEELWSASLEWGLGLLQCAFPLVQPEEGDRLLAMVVEQLVCRGLRGKWQFDFSSVDRAQHLRFVRELLDIAQVRFGISPSRELALRGTEGMQSERAAAHHPFLEGERLIIEAAEGSTA